MSHIFKAQISCKIDNLKPQILASIQAKEKEVLESSNEMWMVKIGQH